MLYSYLTIDLGFEDINGNSTESVFLPKKTKPTDTEHIEDVSNNATSDNSSHPTNKRRKKSLRNISPEISGDSLYRAIHSMARDNFTRRRHAADETALLLAKAITSQIRCIAFCKTRCLVEWVFEKALLHLKSSSSTAHFASRIESYRGGYSADARRSIEERFFCGDLWGVGELDTLSTQHIQWRLTH